MPTEQKLLVATTNPGKMKEFRDILAQLPVTWVSLADVGLAGMDVEEHGSTFTANALIKAEAYAKASGLPTLADDSGLVVDALDGKPGVHSARYDTTEATRRARLLREMEGVPTGQRACRFVCVVAVVFPDGITAYAEGRVEGSVGHDERGSNGFGYDPLFVMADGRTLAEWLPGEKNVVSHRGRALEKIKPLLACLLGSTR